MENRKLTFTTNGSELMMLELAAQLKQRGLDLNIGSGHNSHNLFVAESQYEKALIKGEVIARNARLNSLFWADFKGKCHPLSFIPIMKEVIPISRLGEADWKEIVSPDDLRCPKDIRKFFEELKLYCGVKDIRLEYDEKAGAFDVFLLAPFEIHSLMSKRYQGFERTYENSPFVDVRHLAMDGSLTGRLESRRGQEDEHLLSYFYNSLFYNFIKKPEVAGIVPIDYGRIKNESIYLGICHNVKSSEITDVEFLQIGVGLYSIKGKFSTTSSMFKYSTFAETLITDTGEFEGTITFKGSQVDMAIKISVKRQISGDHFGVHDYRNEFFKKLDKDGDTDEVIFTEHFVKVDDGKKLLHYSDQYGSFEYFNLQPGWFIENGIFRDTEGIPIVCKEGSIEFNNLEEIIDLLNGHKKDGSAFRLTTTGK